MNEKSKWLKEFVSTRNNQASFLTLSNPNEINKVPDELLSKETKPETFQNYFPTLNYDDKVPAKVLTKVTKSEAIQSYFPSFNSEIDTKQVPALKEPANVTQVQQSKSLLTHPNVVGKEKPKLTSLLDGETQLTISSSTELTTFTSRTINQPPSFRKNSELGRKSFSKIVNQKEDSLKNKSSRKLVVERVNGHFMGSTSSRKASTALLNQLNNLQNGDQPKTTQPSNAVAEKKATTSVIDCTS